MQSAEKPKNEIQRLEALRKYQILDTDLEKEYDDIVALAAQICETPISIIGFINGERQWYKAKIGLEDTEVHRDLTFCAHTILQDELFIVSDSTQDSRFADNPFVTTGMKVRFYAGKPLTTPDGFNIGTLCVVDSKPRTLSEHQKSALEILGRQVIAQMELGLKAKLLKQSREILEKEHSKLQKALAKNNAFNQALDNGALVSVTDKNGNIVKVNSIFCKVSGYTQEELVGKNHRIVNSGYHSEEFWDKMWDRISNGKVWRGEVCNRSKNGELYWVDTAISPIYDEKGDIEAYLSIRTLVTKRKIAEQTIKEQSEALAFSQKRLLFLLEATFMGIWEFSFATEVFHWDKTCQNIFGLEKESSTHEEWENLIQTEYLDAVREAPADFLAGKMASYSVEYRTKPIKGISKYILAKASILNEADGTPKSMIGTIEDITERKKIEQMIQLQSEAMQTSLGLILTLRQKSEAARQESEKLLSNIKASIKYSQRIQKAIIPQEKVLQKHFDCFVFFKPKDVVSGDFYWFADKHDKKILAVGDCTGHGVSGAFMTMIGNNILNQIVHDYEIHEPDEILNLMPILLEKTLSHSDGELADGMDISIITIEKLNLASFENPQGLKLGYAGAMNSLYYVQNHEFKEIKADKVPISGQTKEDFSYQKHEITIKNLADSENTKGLTMYLCSDGFQDQFGGERNRKFMVGNFKKLLLKISEYSMPEQKVLLDDAFDAWQGNHKQTDDVLVVGIRI